MNAREKALLERIDRLEKLVESLIGQFSGYRIAPNPFNYYDPLSKHQLRDILHTNSPMIQKLQDETAALLRFAGLEWKDPIPPVPARIGPTTEKDPA